MTKAEELKQIAADARTKTDAEIQFDALYAKMKEAAAAGAVAIPMTKYTVEGLKYTKGMIGMNVDYEKMYKDQEELFRICRENGLEVRLSDPDLPSTLDINLSQADRERIELFKSRVEKDVLIIWDTEEFDRP